MSGATIEQVKQSLSDLNNAIGTKKYSIVR